ncbi:glycosyltransferase [Lactobacillus helveticus]|uniref:glycosyltransferase n=1 Tax=Lactobacillus helveticus TaxID=1587 RepID=UPI0021820929|nr:glycosyltransferase [Lactobacillus helveticus]MCT0192288.1 glycosyltransferase [Lactobacillus helveticus]
MNKKTKILFLQKTTKFSGAENMVIMLMKLLSPQFEVYYVSPVGPIKRKVESAGLNFVALPSLSIVSIIKTINRIKPDIIHSTDYSMSAVASILGNKVPVVSHLHNDPTWITKPWNLKTIIYALSIKKIRKIVAVSSSVKKEFFYKRRMKKKIIIIPNVVDLAHVRRMAYGASKKYDLVFLGRLTYQKNPLLFCKLIKELKRTHPCITAAIIGEGELKAQIKKYINDNKLNDNIEMLGFQENPYRILNNSKISVLPSRFEGFGLSAVEAMSLGKPVVCSNVGGLVDVVTEKSGKLCNTFEDYVREILKLLQNQKYYQIKSNEAKRQAEKFGNLKNYRDNFIKIYEEILK